MDLFDVGRWDDGGKTQELTKKLFTKGYHGSSKMKTISMPGPSSGLTEIKPIDHTVLWNTSRENKNQSKHKQTSPRKTHGIASVSGSQKVINNNTNMNREVNKTELLHKQKKSKKKKGQISLAESNSDITGNQLNFDSKKVINHTINMNIKKVDSELLKKGKKSTKNMFQNSSSKSKNDSAGNRLTSDSQQVIPHSTDRNPEGAQSERLLKGKKSKKKKMQNSMLASDKTAKLEMCASVDGRMVAQESPGKRDSCLSTSRRKSTQYCSESSAEPSALLSEQYCSESSLDRKKLGKKRKLSTETVLAKKSRHNMGDVIKSRPSVQESNNSIQGDGTALKIKTRKQRKNKKKGVKNKYGHLAGEKSITKQFHEGCSLSPSAQNLVEKPNNNITVSVSNTTPAPCQPAAGQSSRTAATPAPCQPAAGHSSRTPAKFNKTKLKAILSSDSTQSRDVGTTEPLLPDSPRLVSPAARSHPPPTHPSQAPVTPPEQPPATPPEQPPATLAQRMKAQLQAARFRYLNQQLYQQSGTEAYAMMKRDPDSFHVYHAGFESQVSKWPENPVDKCIQYIQSRDSKLVVADFGCGDAKIAQSVKNKVHSFDLVALSDRVTACDMANVPLSRGSVDVAVFCLALMGTNLSEFICEANRVLKMQGVLLVAEVVSRFEKIGSFVSKMTKMGFSVENKDTTNKMFIWFEFRKTGVPKKDRIPDIRLAPCIYKRR